MADRVESTDEQAKKKARVSGGGTVDRATTVGMCCFVCYHYMVDEIYQCANRHNLCGACHAKVGAACPMCRNEGGRVRAGLIEHLRDRILVRCSYDGCDETCQGLPAIAAHEKVCPTRPRCTRCSGYADTHVSTCPTVTMRCPLPPHWGVCHEGTTLESVCSHMMKHAETAKVLAPGEIYTEEIEHVPAYNVTYSIVLQMENTLAAVDVSWTHGIFEAYAFLIHGPPRRYVISIDLERKKHEVFSRASAKGILEPYTADDDEHLYISATDHQCHGTIARTLSVELGERMPTRE